MSSVEFNRCLHGDALEQLRTLPDACMQTCVTSPPYWVLRDYGVPGQLGLEATPEEYVARMVSVFAEVRRVLRDDGTIWVNLGDSYAGSVRGPAGESATVGACLSGAQTMENRTLAGLKPKDLVGIPWRVAFALQSDGWYLRQDIIWSKPNPMPESVTDRCTKAHEYLFLLSKSARYYFDAEAIAEPPVTPGLKSEGRGTSWHDHKDDLKVGDRRDADCNGKFAGKSGARNRRSVWTVPSEPYPDAHFATFPRALIEPCILAGAPLGGVVLDPFMGSGTTAQVAQDLGRRWLGVELNAEYIALQARRTAQFAMQL